MHLKTFVLLHLLDSERRFREYKPTPSMDQEPESQLCSLSGFQKQLEDFVRTNEFPLDIKNAADVVNDLLEEGIFEVRKGKLRLSEDENHRRRVKELLYDKVLVFFLTNGADAYPDLIEKAHKRLHKEEKPLARPQKG